MPTETPPRRQPSARSAGRRLLRSGFVDSLVGPHGIDRYLELVRPHWTPSEPRAQVVRVSRPSAGHAVSLTLRPNAAFAGFKPGQFVNLTVEIAGVRRSRCYSPTTSAHHEGTIELTIKTHEEGLVSGWLAREARAGMVVGLSAADGDFHLPEKRPGHLLLISGGSGITPVLSMLRTLADECHLGRIDFVHYAPTQHEALHTGELENLASRMPGLRLHRSFTREAGAGELDGHFGPKHIARVAADPSAETFVCGPPALIDSVRESWTDAGLDERLHIESFVPPTLAIRTDQAEGTVAFAGAGERVVNDGRTLLEQAEAAGLNPDFGCRMGICATCTCRKSAGAVRNVVSGAISDSEDEDIRLCVSVPVGDVEIAL
ncbi:MAG: ferredoxin reductase [Actinomycetota bacterium]|nr:ferredoxin reductase [Actinomycetota bacterium]